MGRDAQHAVKRELAAELARQRCSVIEVALGAGISFSLAKAIRHRAAPATEPKVEAPSPAPSRHRLLRLLNHSWSASRGASLCPVI